MNGKKSFVSASLVYVALGLVLIFFPGLTAGLFCTVVGLLLLAYGAITVISFFVHRGGSGSFSLQAELILGVVSLVIGVFFLTHSDFIISIIPVLLGFYILIDALVNLKRGLDMRALGYAGWTATLVMSAVSLVLGGLILWNPFDTGLLLWRIIGGAFLYLGLSDFWAIYTLNRLVRGVK